MSGVQERLIVGVSRFGDRLLKAHVATHRVTVPTEHGTSEQPGHSPVAILEGVNDEQVQYEQQPVQVQNQASVQRAPVVLEQVVLRASR